MKSEKQKDEKQKYSARFLKSFSKKGSSYIVTS